MQNGLMNPPMPQQGAGGGMPADPAMGAPMQGDPAQGMPQGQQAGAGFEPREASPEQQAAYNRTIVAALRMVREPQMRPALIKMLEGEGDPVQGLATASANIFARIATAGEEAGEQLDGPVLFNAATEIVQILADVSDAASIGSFAEDRDALEGAYFQTLDQIRGMMDQAGRLDRESAESDLGALQRMSESGELEQMLRGLAENDPRQRRDMPAEEPPMEEPPQRGLMG